MLGVHCKVRDPRISFIHDEELYCERNKLSVSSSNLRHDACQAGGTISSWLQPCLVTVQQSLEHTGTHFSTPEAFLVRPVPAAHHVTLCGSSVSHTLQLAHAARHVRQVKVCHTQHGRHV